jgi:hypothetical protein
MKKLFLRPNLYLWSIGLIVSVTPFGSIIAPHWIWLQGFGLLILIYNGVLVIVLREKYTMFD